MWPLSKFTEHRRDEFGKPEGQKLKKIDYKEEKDVQTELKPNPDHWKKTKSTPMIFSFTAFFLFWFFLFFYFYHIFLLLLLPDLIRNNYHLFKWTKK
jgi:hypothetical protein